MNRRLARKLAAMLTVVAMLGPAVANASEVPVKPVPPMAIPAEPMPLPPGKGEPVKNGPPVLAEIKVSREEAIALATKLFEIPADLAEPNVSIHQSPSGAVWNLNWNSPAKRPDRMNISVEVDATTGKIRSYNRWRSQAEEAAPLTYTRDEALRVATGWLEILAGDQKDSLRLVDNPLSYGYYPSANAAYEFRWERLIHGYPAGGDGANVAVNARTGELERFYFNWNQNAKYEEPGATLDRAAAEAAYRKLVPMVMQYQRFHKPGTDESQWRLVYRPVSGWYPLLNQEGRIVGPSGEAVNLEAFREYRRVPAPEQPYEAPAKPLDQEQALAMAMAVAGRTDAPTNTNYSEYSNEKYKTRAWSFSWHSKGEPKSGEYNTEVRIDAERGVVLNVNNWTRWEPLKADEEPPVTQEQAETAAVEFVRKFRPDLAGSLALGFSTDQYWIMEKEKMGGMRSDVHRVSFTRLHNGVPIADHNVTVEVDARSGKIRSYWGDAMDLSRDSFPDASDFILADEAMDAFLKHQGIQVTWMTFYRGQSEGQPPTPVLIWGPRSLLPLAAIDAVTGAPLDHQGRDLVEALKRPADIEGHFAEREIQLLWARGIFELKDGKFKPDEVATAAELARWLVLARGLQPYMEYNFSMAFGKREALAARAAEAPSAAYFGAAMQSGIVLADDFADDADFSAPVTRELFALWAARSMGYARITTMRNSIDMPFADKAEIGKKYANAVGLLHGLGILQGDGGNFQPQRELTRGEAAKIIFAITSEPRR